MIITLQENHTGMVAQHHQYSGATFLYIQREGLALEFAAEKASSPHENFGGIFVMQNLNAFRLGGFAIRIVGT